MRLVNVYALVGLSFTLDGCFKMDVVHSGTDSVRGKTSKTSLVQAITSETGAITAAFSAQSTTTQILSAATSETMSGTVLALPPGTLSIDTSISIEESAPIATETMGAELGINAVMQQTGTAVSVQTDVPMDAKQPFTLSMPLPVLGLVGDEQWSNLIVIYKVKIAADGLTVAGVIPRSDIIVENNVAKISVMNFGAFQTALTNIPVVEKKQVETKSEIVTKQQVVQLPALSVTSRVPFVAKENATVVISGSNFRPGLMLALGGKKVGDLKVLSDSKASFVAPKVEGLGLTKLTAEQDGVSQSVSMFYSGTGDLPVITEVESEVCSGKKYYNANGEVKVGTKVCPTAAEMANLVPANLKSGVVVMGVTGTMQASPAACASDGESNCVASASYPAVNKAAVNPAQILSGASVAGVSGTYVGSVAVADCATDGEMNCKTTSSFKAIGVSSLSAKMSSIRTTVTIAGLNGTLADCASDGLVGCVASSSYPAMQLTGAAAKIVSGQTLGGVGGSAAARPADCATDGGQNCVAVASFPAMLLSGAAAKIASGDTLGGVGGTAAVRPSDCAADGATGCVAIANFPAVDKINKLSVGNLAKIRSSLSIAGESGTLADCASDGEAGCFVLGPSYAAAFITGADAKIVSGQTLAGIAGSATARPPDCASDGAQNCVAVVNYPAMNVTGAAAKILTGQTLAGVSGTAALRPADCSVDGSSNCVAVMNFPAVDKLSVLQPNISKIRSSVTIAGVAGTLVDCAADGTSGCVANTAYKAVDATLLTAGNIKKNMVIGGVTGMYPSGSYPLALADSTPDLDNATFNIKIKSASMFEYFSSDGTRYTGNGNPSLLGSNIRNGMSIFGEMGTFGPDCTADAAVGCLTTVSFPAANINAVTPFDIRAGKTIGGKAGNLFFPGNGSSPSTSWNYTSGTGANAATGVADFYDSIDDYANGMSFPSLFPPGWPIVNQGNWMRDAASDDGVGGGTAGNGACEGSETCVWVDKLSGRQWLAPDTSGYTWTTAITRCENLTTGIYNDWRLPTQKELMQAYISGILSIKTNLSLNSSPLYWSATTDSASASYANAYTVEVSKGTTSSSAKSGTQYVMCVR